MAFHNPRLSTTLLVLLGLSAAPCLAGQKPAAPPTPAAHAIAAASPGVEADYQAGLRAYYQGLPAEADAAFRRAIQGDAHCAMAYWGLSRCLAKAGRQAEAL